MRPYLFDDASFTGFVQSVAPTFSGGYSLSGSLAGVEMGTMTLVVNGEVVAGTVRTPEATYRIRPAGAGLHAVSEIDPSRLPPLGPQPPAGGGRGCFLVPFGWMPRGTDVPRFRALRLAAPRLTAGPFSRGRQAVFGFVALPRRPSGAHFQGAGREGPNRPGAVPNGREIHDRENSDDDVQGRGAGGD